MRRRAITRLKSSAKKVSEETEEEEESKSSATFLFNSLPSLSLSRSAVRRSSCAALY